MMKLRIGGALAAMTLATGLAGPVAAADDTFRIGVITFLSGQAAESFGVPALERRQGAGRHAERGRQAARAL